jgi:hypothetical protein
MNNVLLLDITRRFLGIADAVGYVNTQEFIQCKLKRLEKSYKTRAR